LIIYQESLHDARSTKYETSKHNCSAVSNPRLPSIQHITQSVSSQKLRIVLPPTVLKHNTDA